MTVLREPLAAARSGIAEGRFSAMGSSIHLIVVGARPSHVSAARELIASLEHTWSRFVPTSELCRMNASHGTTFRASDDLFAAVSRAVDAWWTTNGRFDPTVIESLEAFGYDRTFASVGDGAIGPYAPSPGCAGVELDPLEQTIWLPPGVAIDLGGIGKGLAADRVVTELFRLGADGVLANVGGDLRVAGSPPGPNGWTVEIENPFRSEGVCVALADGAVCTSSRLRKRWRRGERDVHHLIDPRTGEPAVSSVVTATVVASEAWWAEVLAKIAFIDGARKAAEDLERFGVHGLFFEEDGTSMVAGDWREILA